MTGDVDARGEVEVESRRRAQNAHPKKKRPPRPGTTGAAARAAVLLRSEGKRGAIPHNAAVRAIKSSAYELETNGAARPPRKSTRRSPTHLKNDSALRNRATQKAASPQLRSGRRQSPSP